MNSPALNAPNTNFYQTKNLNPGNANELNVVIEIPFGSNVKYEINENTGVLMVKRVMHTAVVYPVNYGFVPSTLAGDGDPADVLVLNEYPLYPGSVIPCRLIGVLVMEDEKGMDEKLLAVPVTRVDARFDDIKDIADLPKATINRIKHFFETYKLLEPNKWAKITGYEDVKKANEILEQAIKNYK